MANLRINHEKINHKKMMELIDLCPFNAIEEKDGQTYINSGCKMCKLCVKNGDGTIDFIEDEVVTSVNKKLWNGITVYIDHFNGIINPVSLELVGKAKVLAAVIDHPVQGIVMGYNTDKVVEELQHYGLDEIHVYNQEKLEHFKVQNYTEAFADYIGNRKPSSILVGATTLGRSLAPRVAARFRTGLTADCTVLEMKPNTDLVQIRPAFGGNIMAQIITERHRPQLCTVRAKVFDAPERTIEKTGRLIKHDIDPARLTSTIKVLDIVKKDKEISIADAEVIVAIGRGLEKEEDLEMINKFADLIGGKVACTRPIMENGWLSNRLQVGLSGRTVKPRLIFAIGIQGAVQFTAGMSGSETIIAINKDENAAIFDVAHYGVVGDLYTVIPELIEKLKDGEKIVL
jgi:electron transfer flavoprotein alpha subunit